MGLLFRLTTRKGKHYETWTPGDSILFNADSDDPVAYLEVIASGPQPEDRKQPQEAKPDASELDQGRWEDEGGHSR
jgi:hypothetical protein